MANADVLEPVVRSLRLLDTGASRIRQGRVGRVPWLPSRARRIAACAAFVLFFSANLRATACHSNTRTDLRADSGRHTP